jgi:integrase
MTMSRIKQNSTQRNGKRILGSWSIIANLSTGQERITLKGIKDKKVAKRFQNKVNEIELQSKLFPHQKDWLMELYIACGREDLIPNFASLIPNISEGFDELIATKMMYKTIKSNSTIEAYRLACRLLIEVVGDIPINHISAIHKSKLQFELNSRGYTDNTINIRVRNIMQFFRWCHEMQYLETIPFKIPQIQVKPSTKTWIKPEELDRILSAIDCKVVQAYILVAYHTGLRLRELNTDPSDKQYKGLYHSIKRVDNKWQLMVKGKGGKIKPTILPDVIKPHYDIMVGTRRNPHTISRYFKRACHKVGLSHYHFHHTRHSKASNTCMQSSDIYFNKNLLRHDSVKTTEKYLNDTRLLWEKLVEGESYNA